MLLLRALSCAHAYLFTYRMCAAQMLDQLRWRPEDARLSDSLLSKATALHTIVPGEHRIGTPQVIHPCLLWLVW